MNRRWLKLGLLALVLLAPAASWAGVDVPTVADCCGCCCPGC